MSSGCGLFDESETFTDPCAEGDLVCTPGAEGFTCGEGRNKCGRLNLIWPGRKPVSSCENIRGSMSYFCFCELSLTAWCSPHPQQCVTLVSFDFVVVVGTRIGRNVSLEVCVRLWQ